MCCEGWTPLIQVQVLKDISEVLLIRMCSEQNFNDWKWSTKLNRNWTHNQPELGLENEFGYWNELSPQSKAPSLRPPLSDKSISLVRQTWIIFCITDSFKGQLLFGPKISLSEGMIENVRRWSLVTVTVATGFLFCTGETEPVICDKQKLMYVYLFLSVGGGCICTCFDHGSMLPCQSYMMFCLSFYCTYSGWLMRKLCIKLYIGCKVGAQPWDSLVKSHPNVKLVLITPPNHPTTASRQKHVTQNRHKQRQLYLETTCHSETIQRAALIGKCETKNQTSQVWKFLTYLINNLCCLLSRFFYTQARNITLQLLTPPLDRSTCIHSTLQLVSGAGWLVHCPRGDGVKVTSIT